MKRRAIFCLFISIYLLYNNKNNLAIQMEELSVISYLVCAISASLNDLGRFTGLNLNYNTTNQTSQTNENRIKEEGKRLFNKHIDKPHHVKKVESSGFYFEEHKILTQNGYILTNWRIYGKINEPEEQKLKRKPVILQHGLFDTSYTWLILDSSESLALLLAEEGYDVWLTNSRGNALSHEHTNEEYDSSKFYSKFWDFSFHEMAVFDLTANVFYIKNLTKFEKVTYIGHSQGTVQYFIQHTINPNFIEKNIEKFVSLGTVVNVFNTVSKLYFIFYRQVK